MKQQREKIPAPGCLSEPAQLEANKQVVRDFFSLTGSARAALIDEKYIQHDPVFKKRAEENSVSDYTEITNAILNDALWPAQGRILEILIAECDIVMAVNKRSKPDPTSPSGKMYDYYTFDTFRVRDGKLVEHWDGVEIQGPASR